MVVKGGGFAKTSRAVAHRLCSGGRKGGQQERYYGRCSVSKPRPDAVGPDKGGARTAGTGMQRFSPAAQGERGSQQCAELKMPSPSHKVKIYRGGINKIHFHTSTRLQGYKRGIVHTSVRTFAEK